MEAEIPRVYGLEYDFIAPRISKTPQQIIEVMNFRADLQLLERYKHIGKDATMRVAECF